MTTLIVILLVVLVLLGAASAALTVVERRRRRATPPNPDLRADRDPPFSPSDRPERFRRPGGPYEGNVGGS